MDKDRSFRSLAVIAILVAVVGISVAFATLSQVLNINGTGKLKGGSWLISFNNLAAPQKSGNANIDATAQLNTGSTVMEFSATLIEPGDSVTYYFDVKNFGLIDAEVTNYNIVGTPQAGAEDITYSLTYADGSTIAVGDDLDSGDVKNLKLVVSYDINATNPATSDVSMNLVAVITYTQK